MFKRDNAELNIIFLSSQKIRALNRAYLGTDTATDVLAFPPGGTRVREKGKRVKGKEREFLGDIAISSDRASANARIYGTRFTEELALYVIHGTLHLLGYEDATEEGRAAMRRKENELLQKAGKHT